jgi:hypothetical protein
MVYRLLSHIRHKEARGHRTLLLIPVDCESWEKQKRDYPGFADYERKTTRRIPVVILETRG